MLKLTLQCGKMGRQLYNIGEISHFHFLHMQRHIKLNMLGSQVFISTPFDFVQSNIGV